MPLKIVVPPPLLGDHRSIHAPRELGGSNVEIDSRATIESQELDQGDSGGGFQGCAHPMPRVAVALAFSKASASALQSAAWEVAWRSVILKSSADALPGTKAARSVTAPMAIRNFLESSDLMSNQAKASLE